MPVWKKGFTIFYPPINISSGKTGKLAEKKNRVSLARVKKLPPGV
jgi:hypothetical protein